eukprot:5498030-Pyramimonas_sp.AAC.1
MKNKKLTARVVEVLYVAFGSRWPSFRVLFPNPADLTWKFLGVYRYGEPNENGKISDLIHISGA